MQYLQCDKNVPNGAELRVCVDHEPLHELLNLVANSFLRILLLLLSF